MLFTGASGNVLSALAHDPRHLAIGASTATFGAIGALATLRMLPSHTAQQGTRRRWVVMMTAVLLLALLGTARDADVLGHVLGLIAGALAGVIAAVLVRRPPGTAVQWALTSLAALTVAAAWYVALRTS
jgi:membrane associated rhomboid family serine protease